MQWPLDEVRRCGAGALMFARSRKQLTRCSVTHPPTGNQPVLNGKQEVRFAAVATTAVLAAHDDLVAIHAELCRSPASGL